MMIMGKSGSGKTTLLNVLGFLDKIDKGKFYFNGKDVSNLNENQRSEYRCSSLGYVFQQFNLIDTLTVYQNIEIPLVYSGVKDKNIRKNLIESRLEDVGLLDNNPSIIFADEPTGALDSDTGRDIMNLLTDLNKSGTTIIMVTHDLDMTKYASRVVNLKDGVFVEGVV